MFRSIKKVFLRIYTTCNTLQDWRREKMDSDSDDVSAPAQIAAIPNLAVASAFVGRPPAPFLETPDSDKESWNVWLKSWDNYLVVLSSLSPGAISDSVKNAMLLNALGTEGFRLATSDPILSDPTSSYTAVKAAATRLFSMKGSEVHAIKNLLSRRQQSDEMVSSYVTELRALAQLTSLSTFINTASNENAEDYILAAMLALGVKSRTAQQRLLREEALSLKEFTNLASAVESAEADQHVIADSKVGAVAQRGSRPPVKGTKRQSAQTARRRSHSRVRTPNNVCMRCGRPGRHEAPDTCPAINRECSKCGKKGHFARICQATRSATTKVSTVSFITTTPTGNTRKTVPTQSCMKQSTTSAINSAEPATSAADGWNFNLRFLLPNGQEFALPTKLDTGAKATLVTSSAYNNNLTAFPLFTPPTTLVNFDGTTIQGVRGAFRAPVTHNGRTAELTVYVVPDNMESTSGDDAIHLLQLLLDGATQAVRTLGKSDVLACLSDFPALISADMGTFPDFEHTIVLRPNARPLSQKLRVIPIAKRDAVQTEVQRMVDQGIWEPCERSDWASALVPIMKRDGGIRLTTDFTPLNSQVTPTRHPLPNIRDVRVLIAGAAVFTKLDLAKAYYHIQVAEASRPLTATLTPWGVFQYRRLPMGLKDAAAVFQRCVDRALNGIPGCIVYLDDILVFAVSQTEHDTILHKVLERLHQHDFCLNMSKCRFSCQNVTFLGNVLSQGRIKIDPQRLQGLQDMPQSVNTKQLQSFLGAVNYCKEFLKNAASLVEPLQRLLRKGTPWVWGEAQQKAMDNIRMQLCNLPELYTFDPGQLTIVTTDASGDGLGATLSQVQNEQEVPIAYASHTLTAAEKNYATNEREALGVLWALEHWEPYLLGRKFTLRCDHKPLGALLQHSSQRKRDKFIRWSERLSRFDFNFEYIAGTSNCVADCFSRLPAPSPAVDGGIESQSVRIAHVTDGICMLDILQATKNDNEYSTLLQAIRNSTWKNNNLQAYHNVRSTLDIKEERSVPYAVKDDRIVVPTSIRQRILKLAHKGHPGIVRMKQKLCCSYWWPSMDAEAERHVRYCTGCQASSKSADKAEVTANRSVPTPAAPWTKLALDITGPFYDAPTSQKYIVVAIDYTSKFAALHSCTDISSNRIVKWLDELFCEYGLVSQIVTDNGRQFVSERFEQFLAARDIQHIRTTPYHPESNGLVERFNRLLKTGIQAFTRKGLPWNEGLRQLLINYRGNPHGSDNKSPGERMFGRSYRQPHQVAPRTFTCPTPADAPTLPVGPPAKSASFQHTTLKRGAEVLIRDSRPAPGKGRATWRHHPYTIQHRNDKTYTLVRSDGTPHSRIKRHRRDIKRFFRPDDFPEQRIIIFNTPLESPSSAETRGPAAPLGPPTSARPIRLRKVPDRYGISVDSGRLAIRERRVPYSRQTVHAAKRK